MDSFIANLREHKIEGTGEDVADPAAPPKEGVAAVKPVKPKKKQPSKPPEIFPMPPMRMMLYGGTGTGKTHFLLNTILYSKHSPWDRVLWVAPKFSLEQPSLEEAQKKLKDRLIRIEGDTQLGIVAPHDAKLEAAVEQGHIDDLAQLVVFDDLMSSKSRLLTDLFTSGRHRGVSVAVLNQRIFTGTAGDRTRRLNADWFVLFHLGGTGEVGTLAQQLDRETWKEVTAAYKQAVEGKPLGSYLLIDKLAARSTDPKIRSLQYRDSSLTRVFPDLS